MQRFELGELLAHQRAKASAGSGSVDDLYLEFLRVPAMSAGLYVLAAGAQDLQEPHGQDEIYVVLSGRGAISVDGESSEVGRGSVVYVPAVAPHHFHSIAEDLELLVLFAPAESP